MIAPLLSIHEHICEQQSKFDDEVRRLAKSDETTRRLMTVPGVGVVKALTFRSGVSVWPTIWPGCSRIGAIRRGSSTASSICSALVCSRSAAATRTPTTSIMCGPIPRSSSLRRAFFARKANQFGFPNHFRKTKSRAGRIAVR